MNNPHSNPLIYFNNLKSTEVKLLLQFIYLGQCEVSQEGLVDFLAAGKELMVKGLVEENTNIYQTPVDQDSHIDQNSIKTERYNAYTDNKEDETSNISSYFEVEENRLATESSIDDDFDQDVIDHAYLKDEEDQEEVAQAPRVAPSGRRGPDIQWREVVRWEDEGAFKHSDEFKLLKMFTRRKKPWKSEYADYETWACKHARKANYKKCPRMVKLEYLAASRVVVMLDNCMDHDHSTDPDYGGGKKFCWTPVQEGIVLAMARSRATAVVVDRELRRQEARDSRGNFPTLGQINTKKNYMLQTVAPDKGLS